MQNTRKAATTAYRERRKREGVVLLEMQVRREDAPLLRNVANALADPAQAVEVRALLRTRFVSPKTRSLKELLADAPLDGIDLGRSADLGSRVAIQ
jgi:hypothetical protein